MVSDTFGFFFRQFRKQYSFVKTAIIAEMLSGLKDAHGNVGSQLREKESDATMYVSVFMYVLVSGSPTISWPWQDQTPRQSRKGAQLNISEGQFTVSYANAIPPTTQINCSQTLLVVGFFCVFKPRMEK